MTVSFENITPVIAEEYLKVNKKNRTVKTKAVEDYARRIQQGEFKTTHQGIAFDTDGELIDGQHRLLAVIVSGKPARMMVSRGVPKDTISAVDRGVTRSVRDVLSIGYDSTKDNLTAKVLTNQKVISALSQLVACNYKRGAIKLGVKDIEHVFEEFSKEVVDIYNNIITKFGSKGRAPMISAAIAAESHGVSIDALSKFFGVFFNDDVVGCDNYNVHAALNWRRQIDAARANRVSIDRKKLYLGTQNAIYHFVNNTDVQKIVALSSCRYDVESKLQKALQPICS